MRFVWVRDPQGNLSAAACCCTSRHAPPEQIRPGVVLRWSVEVTCEDARAHLGLETPRQWADPASARVTPVLLGLFSLVTVQAWRFCPSGHLPVEGSAWYHKPEATFAACLAVVRQQIWRARYLVNSAPQTDFVQLPREAFDLLFNDLPLAA